MSKWAVVGVLIVIAGAALGFYLLGQHALDNGVGEAAGAWFVPRASGTPVLVVENQIQVGGRRTQPTSRTRLRSIDVSTGATRERHWDDTNIALQCWTRGSDAFSCDELGTLDPTTLATSDPTDDRSFHVPDPQTCSKTSDVKLGKTQLDVYQDQVGIDEPAWSDPYSRHTGFPPGTRTVALTGKPQFLAMPNRVDLPLVTQAGALAVRSPGKQWMISLIAADGRATWSTPIGSECQQAQIVGDTVIVATKGSAPRALAIDLATGAVRWHVD